MMALTRAFHAEGPALDSFRSRTAALIDGSPGHPEPEVVHVPRPAREGAPQVAVGHAEVDLPDAAHHRLAPVFLLAPALRRRQGAAERDVAVRVVREYVACAGGLDADAGLAAHLGIEVQRPRLAHRPGSSRGGS
jgi:hypothetical protein